MIKKLFTAVMWFLTAAMLIFDVVVITTLIKNGTFINLWGKAAVQPQVNLPTPMKDYSQPYEYCVLQKNAGLASKLDAGTPVPMDPVYLGSTPTEIIIIPTPFMPVEAGATEKPVPTEEPVTTFEPTPTFEPTATQPVYNELDSWQVEIVDMGKYVSNNYHIVVIGIGFTDAAQNEVKLHEIISGMEVNFAEVKVDFAYVRNPLNLNLVHADQAVDFSNPKDFADLMIKIQKVHPADSLVIAIDTSLYLGQANRGKFAMVTGSDPNSIYMASHETAHLLGLGDGYKAFYPDGYLPNSELFYLDGMPRILSDALSKLKTMPPMYEVGTCNGKPLYTFYERSNNVMGDYRPQGPNSWGDSLFTPLQIQIMNDFVATLKGGN